MFIREVTAKSSSGRRMTYVQLVHNERDAKTGYSRAKVLYGFGRKDALDVVEIYLAGFMLRYIGADFAACGTKGLRSDVSTFALEVKPSSSHIKA